MQTYKGIMYIQIFEVITSSLAIVSAGLSYVNYKAAKKYSGLSNQAAKISATKADFAGARAIEAKNYDITAEQSARAAVTNAAIAVLNAGVAGDHCNKAASFSANAESFELAAKEHVVEAAESFAKQASVHAECAAEHVEKAAEHVATAGTLSVAVNRAAQKAAEKSQVQAECYACRRAVNSYTLRSDGKVVCKYCSDR